MNETPKLKPIVKKVAWSILIVILVLILFFDYFQIKIFQSKKISQKQNLERVKSADILTTMPQLDTAAYDKKLNLIANNKTPASSTPNSVPNLWPVKTAYPNYGALLPFNRIVAYYGNLYSKGMGILGEYPENIMLDKLAGEVSKWQEADPATPVIPALHYIAVVAQGGGGRDGKYRTRMPDREIEKVLAMAQKINGIVFLDIQPGQSDVQTEVPLLGKYLKMPNVHLGIDPEFAMPDGARPGTVIGTLDSRDINFAANFLSDIVKQYNLPPKILVIHRFTEKMVTNYKNITPLPEVQIVMNMDGFGSQAVKINTYKQFIYREPVQFTGFKMFYKNDTIKGLIFEPSDLLKLNPIPVYIQYQ